MKHLVTAVSVALLATSAAANSAKPFEQLDLDRARPHVAERSVAGSIDTRALPYEQVEVDRALPSLDTDRRQYAASGTTRSDSEISGVEESGFEDDHNFIAPAQ